MSGISPITLSTPYADTASQSALVSSSGSTNNGQNIDAVSKDFEAVFLTQMMGSMFSGEEFTNFFGGGATGDIYKGFMLNEYGKMMSQVGGIGLASQVKQELLKLQETKS